MRGGKREGAGRKKALVPKKPYSYRLTEEENKKVIKYIERIRKMNKLEMATEIVNHPLWEGNIKTADELINYYSEEEIHDIYTEMERLEEET